MDASYWASMQTANRTSVPVANVESNQAGFMPYSGVEVIPAASLELLINQQRLAGASGISFLPYAGGPYTSQMLDGSAVPAQMILPGVAVTTASIQPQAQCNPNVQSLASSYRPAEHSLSDRSTTGATVLPISSVVSSSANVRQLPPLKQPFQSINLTDLLDYSFLLDHGLTETAGTVDLRNPAILANMLQSLNAANLPPTSGIDERVAQASQHAGAHQFPPAKQTMQGGLLSSFQEASSVNQQRVALSDQRQSGASLYAGQGAVAPTGTVLQPAEPKAAVPSGVVWPWSDQVLVADKSEIDGAVVHLTSCPSSVSSSSMPVLYEAVSPPIGNIDNMSFALLENLQYSGDMAPGYQLNSLLGSTVDASAILAAVPQNVTYTSQQSNTVAWTGVASYSGTADGRMPPALEANDRSAACIPLPTVETVVNRHSVGELDKTRKQKANLGIVLPMTHSSRDERDSTTSQTSAFCKSAAMSRSSESSSVDQQGQYMTSSQLSVEKPGGPVVDSATGGIVLTNITGNVYVNQYTMLPGGAPPLDNALLHADYGIPSAAGSLAYDAVPIEGTHTVVAPPVAVMLSATEDELQSFAPMPLTTSASSVQQPSNPPRSVGSARPPAQKSVVPESSICELEASSVLAAKPSNKFESSFLQFICGHKAETLSSVLNSPIKTRPTLPKYVPEPRRARPVQVTVSNIADKVEVTSVGSVSVARQISPQTTITSLSSVKSSETTTVTTTTTTTATASISSANAEWPSVTKLPAKFSHKWKNRTSLSSTSVGPSSVAVTSQSVAKDIEVISSKSSNSSVEVLPSSSGKTKCQNTKWTVSKKSKLTKSQGSGLPVLVLKAVPAVSTARSSSASKSSR